MPSFPGIGSGENISAAAVKEDVRQRIPKLGKGQNLREDCCLYWNVLQTDSPFLYGASFLSVQLRSDKRVWQKNL